VILAQRFPVNGEKGDVRGVSEAAYRRFLAAAVTFAGFLPLARVLGRGKWINGYTDPSF